MYAQDPHIAYVLDFFLPTDQPSGDAYHRSQCYVIKKVQDSNVVALSTLNAGKKEQKAVDLPPFKYACDDGEVLNHPCVNNF